MVAAAAGDRLFAALLGLAHDSRILFRRGRGFESFPDVSDMLVGVVEAHGSASVT
jgi:hypothetical protein